ncbi:YheU family protein [Arsenophonus endosymbiont of Bemisia tabaci]|uniref:YheU family protein n=1 Tax=Arsenophonus endosymbiont of Bemisia tabaci TaxID=536059 RepID=UPI0015F71CA1|nr:YheU family protein [Arsenophonus endosymbiont of Bemisia tabaci]CAA2929992.1 hypothetical protein ARSQ2_01105 [Arsenophonus endosymbiont of Bemisia tabaci Q2]
MIILWQQLTAGTLNNLIESFVLRKGTHYGKDEKTLEEKVEDIKQQLRLGSIVLVWSELHETINILPKKNYILK